ncbi:MAG: hypothetical protein HZB51_06950 [Chloroflexi bacterium]|nr:hypothetical protein [Chloroflexota bacterium]
MNPAQSFDDAVAEAILRAALDDESRTENAAEENSEWLSERMSECYND